MQNRDEDSDELSLLIRCQEDRDTAVRLHSRYLPDECGIGFAVDARADGLQAQLRGVEVWVWDDEWLPDFIARLAADYRGWDGDRTWQTNHLSVRAGFHTGGHVALTWHLHRWLTRSDTWQASVTTWLEAGEQMSNLAADLREFLPMPAPSR
ncbi:DUF6228 family protein [Catenuloplanes japonicus]|uniref:DUF6228 family protein n=1 Tax=Catenuloplanes japonicus TaxID=33876 RepID=UPI0018DE6686|nr:DUF6228 family protein [Catenuloplanes japonicus]